MKTYRLCAVLSAAVMPLSLALVTQGCQGCKKDETVPMPTAAPTPVATTPPPEAAVIVPEEDAGPDGDAEAEAGKPTGTGKPWDPSGLKACCNALRQNAASMPPPYNQYAPAAAGACDALAATAKDRGSALAQIRAMMKGAGMPAACQ